MLKIASHADLPEQDRRRRRSSFIKESIEPFTLVYVSLCCTILFRPDRAEIHAIDTSDEPDGFGDPLNATRETYDLINQLDGHHPISLVRLF